MRAILACVGATVAASLCVTSGAGAQVAPAPSKAIRALQRTLSRQLNSARGRSGGEVVDLTTDAELWAVKPTTARLPASVEKLYTTTTALLRFGANATLTTTVLGTGSLDSSGTWNGTIYLRGGGDPTFGAAGFDRAAYGTGATVQRLAANLKRAGVSAIDGSIVGDESYFDSYRGTPPTGMVATVDTEGELSALAYNRGFAGRAETTLQRRPALFATQQFAAALRKAGIRTPKKIAIRTGLTPSGATSLTVVHSPRIATLLELTNAPSDNLFAEILLKGLGARFGAGGSTAAGAGVVRAFIARTFGFAPRLNDGSGLSRYDRTTPDQVIALLTHMYGNDDFLDSLAIAGKTGTMQGEMVRTRGAGNCRGKTGTLTDVANLVGYCTARDGDTLAFAFLLNGLTDSTAGHAIEDKMGIALANYNG